MWLATTPPRPEPKNSCEQLELDPAIVLAAMLLHGLAGAPSGADPNGSDPGAGADAGNAVLQTMDSFVFTVFTEQGVGWTEPPSAG